MFTTILETLGSVHPIFGKPMFWALLGICYFCVVLIMRAKSFDKRVAADKEKAHEQR